MLPPLAASRTTLAVRNALPFPGRRQLDNGRRPLELRNSAECLSHQKGGRSVLNVKQEQAVCESRPRQRRNVLKRVAYRCTLQCRLAVTPWLNRRLPSAGPKSDGLFCKLGLSFACLCRSDASRAPSSCVRAAQPHTHQRILLQPRIRHRVCSLQT
jgi:hypothetical protein